MSQVKISDIHAGKPDAKDDISRNKREFMNSYLIPPNLNVKTLKYGDICYIVGNKGLGKTMSPLITQINNQTGMPRLRQ